MFPSYRTPAILACPDDECADACRTAITRAAREKGIHTEVIDLRPDPGALLDQVTTRLCDTNHMIGTKELEPTPLPTLLILEGFDLLEGAANEGPTFPFRSRFQFDREHLWLFMGRDLQRLRRMFGDPRLPLYGAASNITPNTWGRRTPK